MKRQVLVTGGLGFIGANLVRYWAKKYPDDEITILDAMTYASNLQFATKAVPQARLVPIDISDIKSVECVISAYMPNIVIHLAAESHVCRSIDGPARFFDSNTAGTFNLLMACRKHYDMAIANNEDFHFHHVSTDEVFGSLAPGEDRFTEHSQIKPTSPYAATKAASDLLVQSFWHTYGMPITITNCSNNYGPGQHEEKLIPAAIRRAQVNKAMRIYGPGTQVRDWIYVDDHCAAIDNVIHSGTVGERYLVGGDCELTNIDVVARIYRKLGRKLRCTHTDDRPTDDQRYGVDCSKLKELGWRQAWPTLEGDGLAKTIEWYVSEGA